MTVIVQVGAAAVGGVETHFRPRHSMGSLKVEMGLVIEILSLISLHF